MSPTILLGFDGSPDAVAATRWAAHEARLRSATLHILHTYDSPYLSRLDSQTQQVLADAAASTAAEGRRVALDEAPDIDVETSIRVGQPAPEIVQAAERCDLLVLGRRGHKPLHHLLLGSVATSCLHHVDCPVVVVAASADDAPLAATRR